MTAYVIEAPPIYENAANYFLAELGFYRLGYVVERFKLSTLQKFEVDAETPVFGGMESLQIALPDYVGLPYYPPELSDFMYRRTAVCDIDVVQPGEFFKPQAHQHKLFLARVKDDSFQCELLLGKIPAGTQVVVSEAVNFLAEHRVYVHNGEILNICLYKGDPLQLPDMEAITTMVAATKHYAAAYGLDVGVLADGKTALVELNDFCCLGNYGLRAVAYAKCIADRWTEVWKQFHA